jgi:hypothetical protein
VRTADHNQPVAGPSLRVRIGDDAASLPEQIGPHGLSLVHSMGLGQGLWERPLRPSGCGAGGRDRVAGRDGFEAIRL